MTIVFAYKSASVTVECLGPVSRAVPRFAMSSFSGVRADSLLPADSVYLSLFYDALATMVKNDAERTHPVFETLWHFAALHARSLAVSPVAECSRLLAQIDEAMVRFIGLSATGMNHALAYAACRALAWRFAIHGDD